MTARENLPPDISNVGGANMDSRYVARYATSAPNQDNKWSLGSPASYTILPMTSDTTPAGYATTASSTAGGPWLPWAAFDGVSTSNALNAWVSSPTPTYPQWLQIKLPQKISIISYTIVPRFTSGTGDTDSPKDWTLQGSNSNGGPWVVVDMRSNQTVWVAGTGKTYYLASPSLYYSYYRLSITAKDGNLTYLGLAELVLTQINVAAYSNTYNTNGQWNNIYSQKFIGTMMQAKWADVAELFRSDCPLDTGKLVMLGGELEITLCDTELSTAVVGIVSDRPALLMNCGLEGGVKIALMGQIPCLIYGKARKGQRIVASRIPGVARAVEESELASISYYAIIGRVLEDKDSDGVGMYKVVVGAK